MMKHFKQDQHKIPQVYLKKFGYVDQNNHWKVSVIQAGETFTQQKSIKSFTAVTNIFDINSHDPSIVRIFELFNCDLETKYNKTLTELETNRTLSKESYGNLLILICNLIVRSDHWRNWMIGMLKHKNKENFLQIILGHLCKDLDEFQKLKEKHFFKVLVENPPEEIVNRVLLFFTDHLLLRLQRYEIIIIESQNDKPWCTSTNPVVVHNQTYKFDLFAQESEFYFPISPKYLVYCHYQGSEDKINPLRALQSNQIHLASDNMCIELRQIIIENPSEYLIMPGEIHYRKEDYENLISNHTN